MSNGNNSTSRSGIGVLGLLGVLFVGLKLTGFIDWSWWWVTAPFWGGFALFLAICIIAVIVWMIAAYFKRRARYKRFNYRP